MSTQTANYGLVKPEAQDFVDIGIINANMEKIDSALKNKYGLDNKFTTEEIGAVNKNGDTMTGDLVVENEHAMVGVKNLNSERMNRVVSYPNGNMRIENYKDNSNYCGIDIGDESMNLNARLKLVLMNGGKWETYNLYGEHNPPPTAAVVATATLE